jgi:hypothetical protein
MFRALVLLILVLTSLSIFVNNVLPGLIYSTADTESVRVKLLEDKVSVLQFQSKLLNEKNEKSTKMLEAARDDIRLLETKLEQSHLLVGGVSNRLAQEACSIVAASIAILGGGVCTKVSSRDKERTLSRPRRVLLERVKEPDEDHWKEHMAAFPGQMIGFWINTHDPTSEDGFVSAKIHAGRYVFPARHLSHHPSVSSDLSLSLALSLSHFSCYLLLSLSLSLALSFIFLMLSSALTLLSHLHSLSFHHSPFPSSALTHLLHSLSFHHSPFPLTALRYIARALTSSLPLPRSPISHSLSPSHSLSLLARFDLCLLKPPYLHTN